VTHAPYIPTDLAVIIHLTYTRPKKNVLHEIQNALQKPCQQLRAEFKKLGPRPNRTIKEISTARILCAASAAYSQARFAKDIREIKKNFPRGSVKTAHGVSAQKFWEYFSDGPNWDIIHLGMYVDGKTGDILVPSQIGQRDTHAPKRIPADGIENVIRDTSPSLVVIITCDSLALATRIARTTNTIAGYKAINPQIALNWASVFYKYLARGCPLSEAFNRAQDLADPGLLLLAKHDFRLNLFSGIRQLSP
jgi:hypothetical protein